MIISYQAIGRCIWHIDCPKNKYHSGIMSELKDEPENERSLMFCHHCKQTGYYPYGKSGHVCTDEVKVSFEDGKPVKADLFRKIMEATKSQSYKSHDNSDIIELLEKATK